MAEYPHNYPREKEDKDKERSSNPTDQIEREPYREPKRPFDPEIEREIVPERPASKTE